MAPLILNLSMKYSCDVNLTPRHVIPPPKKPHVPQCRNTYLSAETRTSLPKYVVQCRNTYLSAETHTSGPKHVPQCQNTYLSAETRTSVAKEICTHAKVRNPRHVSVLQSRFSISVSIYINFRLTCHSRRHSPSTLAVRLTLLRRHTWAQSNVTDSEGFSLA